MPKFAEHKVVAEQTTVD